MGRQCSCIVEQNLRWFAVIGRILWPHLPQLASLHISLLSTKPLSSCTNLNHLTRLPMQSTWRVVASLAMVLSLQFTCVHQLHRSARRGFWYACPHASDLLIFPIWITCRCVWGEREIQFVSWNVVRSVLISWWYAGWWQFVSAGECWTTWGSESYCSAGSFGSSLLPRINPKSALWIRTFCQPHPVGLNPVDPSPVGLKPVGHKPVGHRPLDRKLIQWTPTTL
jgi:hypothetical protein